MAHSDPRITLAAKGSMIAALLGGVFGLALKPDASNGVYQLGSRTTFAIPRQMDAGAPGLHQPGNLMVLVSNPAAAQPKAITVAAATPATAPAPHASRPAPRDDAPSDAIQPRDEGQDDDAAAPPPRFTDVSWRSAPEDSLNDQAAMQSRADADTPPDDDAR